MDHFSDRLAASIEARESLVCVGLDPVLERLPPALTDQYRPAAAGDDDEAVAACFAAFCAGVIEAVAGTAACVKPQAAFFEQYGAAGWRALTETVACAHAERCAAGDGAIQRGVKVRIGGHRAEQRLDLARQIEPRFTIGGGRGYHTHHRARLTGRD